MTPPGIMLRTISLPVRCGIAALSALAYAFAFPPVGWRWLIVPGISGLLWSLQGLRGSRARAIGFLHGMVVCTVGLPWLWLIFGGFAILLWMILSAFTAGFAWMQSRAEARGLTGLKFVAFTVVNWCGWEFIRAEVYPLKFPWMTPGLAWGPNSLLPWIGVYGAGLFVVLLAVCLVRRQWLLGAATGLLILAVTAIDSNWTAPAADAANDIIVAGIQMETASFDKFEKLTRELPTHLENHASARIQHVVWPEYALPFDVRANARDWAALQKLCKERDITMTVGTQTRVKSKSGWFNTALTLDPSGVLGEHYKAHPVHFFDDGTPGTLSLPVKTSHGIIGTPICFDCDYEGVVRKITAAGAEAIIVPMMDAASWSQMQHEQHAQLFRIRACENRRWFFVCSTSGVSQAIDSHGAMYAKLDSIKEGVLTGVIRRESALTFYTRWGWLTPWCLLAIAAACWIVLLLPRRAAKNATL